MAADGKVKGANIDKVDIAMDFHEVTDKMYADHNIDSILNEYKTALTETHFTFPITHFAVINTLKAISDDKLLMIVADKDTAICLQ